MPYPEHTYQYTLAKDSSKFGEGEEPFAEVGINENDVTMTATVSTAYNSAAKAADPLVDTGICEISMGSILLGQAESARHGVELLGEIIDQYGAGECNSIMLSGLWKLFQDTNMQQSSCQTIKCQQFQI